MGKPHKHAAVIKAWADGAEVEARYPDSQYANSREWSVMSNPAFREEWEYRVKPSKKWFRVLLLKTGSTMCADNEDQERRFSMGGGFARWLTDRIEYEE